MSAILKKSMVALMLIALSFMAGPAFAGEKAAKEVKAPPNPNVFPVTSKPYGKTYKEWSILWWKWAEAIPFGVNPVWNDLTGIHGSIGQSGPVWFLAGAGSGTISRTVTVPAGKPLFFPLSNWINDYPCSNDPSFQPPAGQSLEKYLQDFIKPYVDAVDVLECEIDGEPLVDLYSYRVVSGLFQFTAADDIKLTGDPCVTGSPQLAISDGYWVMLKPLKHGEHVIHFTAGVSAWGPPLDVTYILTVEKEPPSKEPNAK